MPHGYLKEDDRLRKEFEKWAILEYCNQKAVIHEKKGGDKGIDGVTYILSGTGETDKMVLQAKSGAVTRGDVAKLLGDMGDARLAILITLEEPSKGMREKAKSAGTYIHELTGRTCDRIRIVTIRDMLENRENKKTLDLPQSVEALISGLRNTETKQLKLDFQAANLEQQERKKPTAVQKEQPQKRRLAQAE